LSPSQVADSEVFVGHSGTYLLQGYDESVMLQPRLQEGHDISKISSLVLDDVGKRLFRRLEEDRYGILELNKKLVVLLREDASAEDLLRARLEAVHLRVISNHTFDFTSSENFAKQNGKHFCDSLCNAGWNTEHAVFEDQGYRVKLL
jgi:hypothetical protein